MPWRAASSAGGIRGSLEPYVLWRGKHVIPNGEIRQVGNLSRDWSQLFVDVSIASDGSVDAALAALEKAAVELRADPAWSAALVDGPRVLGVESLSLDGTTLRVLARTAPGRQDDVARELRRKIKSRFERDRITLSGVQRVELVGSGSESNRNSGSGTNPAEEN